jgi:hypothetical protein
MNTMKLLPADIQFHEDLRVLVWRPRAYLALAEAAMVEHVKQAASDLRASGKTMFAS